MITKFKIFENNDSKFKIGDIVYMLDINLEPYKKCKIIDVSNKIDPITGEKGNRYILDGYPYSISGKYLKAECEIDSEKYNL